MKPLLFSPPPIAPPGAVLRTLPRNGSSARHSGTAFAKRVSTRNLVEVGEGKSPPPYEERRKSRTICCVT